MFNERALFWLAAILIFEGDVILWVDVMFGFKEVIPFVALLHEVIVKFGFWLVLLFDYPLDLLPPSGFGRLLKAAMAAFRDATSACCIA